MDEGIGNTDEEFIRVVRVLEISGPRRWVENVMVKRWVKGTRHVGLGRIIREGVLGEGYPETLGGDLNGDVNALIFAAARLPLDESPEAREVRGRAELLIQGGRSVLDEEV